MKEGIKAAAVRPQQSKRDVIRSDIDGSAYILGEGRQRDLLGFIPDRRRSCLVVRDRVQLLTTTTTPCGKKNVNRLSISLHSGQFVAVRIKLPTTKGRRYTWLRAICSQVPGDAATVAAVCPDSPCSSGGVH
ncbi:uncharacterized protein LOC125499856 [Athalia rosae]|uniref:uncharacterized protein LOC125499856 n=1 Tax=Athalia rosae TaxID=37344 RepID=UPI002033F819|nr:uncharacterized protein LOC125499856 [Athalia rosae]